MKAPAAAVRTSVRVPLAEVGGREVVADVASFTGLVDGLEHVAVGVGPWRTVRDAGSPVLVRPHSECLTGDVFGSLRCDCGPQLDEALRQMATAGGVLLYLRQEGRGIGLYAKLDAYALQDRGLDTYDANLALGRGADERDYTVAAQMLAALEIGPVDLLTNNPDKVAQLTALGVDVRSQRPTGTHQSPTNEKYLLTKMLRSGHTLRVAPPADDEPAA